MAGINASIGIVERCARDFPKDAQIYFDKEVNEEGILGPFTSNPLTSNLSFSPLNSREKHDSNERRIIMDLSFPPHHSVNDQS